MLSPTETKVDVSPALTRKIMPSRGARTICVDWRDKLTSARVNLAAATQRQQQDAPEVLSLPVHNLF